MQKQGADYHESLPPRCISSLYKKTEVQFSAIRYPLYFISLCMRQLSVVVVTSFFIIDVIKSYSLF